MRGCVGDGSDQRAFKGTKRGMGTTGEGAVAKERVRRADGPSRWVGGSLALESGRLQSATRSLLLRAAVAPHPQ